ncbi:MAG: class I fructose-bisphosphate aldolase [Acidimicrobiia bacterium]|nr:class I fructose-bisphosphate aldolase [Acidimicrobiia bacterium]
MDIQSVLGDRADELLEHECKGISRDDLHLPGPDFVDRVVTQTDRNPRVLRNLQAMFGHGRLADTGYLSILPVDQGIEHSAAASFAPNPKYFDPANIVELAIEGGCNAVASTFGVLGSVSRKYAHRIPFIVKLNHNELLTYPNHYDQIMFGTVEQAFDMGAAGGRRHHLLRLRRSPTARSEEVSEAFQAAHELGMFTVLWCYLRNDAFKKDGVDYSLSADLTGQANHLGVTIEADIIKQKLAETTAATPPSASARPPSSSTTSSPPTTPSTSPAGRWPTASWAVRGSSTAAGPGRAPATCTTRSSPRPWSARGPGARASSAGRKAFQRPTAEGVELLNAVQDVYLDDSVTVA